MTVPDQQCCEHTTDDWRTCACHDCGIDRWIDEQERKCTCCERVECVCLTKMCARCDCGDLRNYCAECGHWFNGHTDDGCFSGCPCREFVLVKGA